VAVLITWDVLQLHNRETILGAFIDQFRGIRAFDIHLVVESTKHSFGMVACKEWRRVAYL
jgi:hypothetical protein